MTIKSAREALDSAKKQLRHHQDYQCGTLLIVEGRIDEALAALPPDDGGDRDAAIEECARNLLAWYPGNANTNAFCAALRSMKGKTSIPPPDADVMQFVREIAETGYFLAEDSQKQLDRYVDTARKLTGYRSHALSGIRATFQPDADVIEREAAIQACEDQRGSKANIVAPLTNAAYDEGCRDCVSALREVPAALPPRQQDKDVVERVAKHLCAKEARAKFNKLDEVLDYQQRAWPRYVPEATEIVAAANLPRSSEEKGGA